jgi:DNA-binding NarL/FixJ family response regulator
VPERLSVLLLERDQWRFRGMSTILEESGQIEIIGERDFSQFLTIEEPPKGMSSPHVVVVAHRLVIEYGLSVVAHLKALFVDAAVLVHGEHDSLEVSAQLMAAGASGYFVMTDPPGFLPKAVGVVGQGKLWGPREAVALMAQRIIERAQRKPRSIPEKSSSVGVGDDELMILRYLLEGLSNKEIASLLVVAEVTVKARLGRLYRKFGVSTRLQLLSAAIRQGLVVG